MNPKSERHSCRQDSSVLCRFKTRRACFRQRRAARALKHHQPQMHDDDSMDPREKKEYNARLLDMFSHGPQLRIENQWFLNTTELRYKPGDSTLIRKKRNLVSMKCLGPGHRSCRRVISCPRQVVSVATEPICRCPNEIPPLTSGAADTEYILLKMQAQLDFSLENAHFNNYLWSADKSCGVEDLEIDERLKNVSSGTECLKGGGNKSLNRVFNAEVMFHTEREMKEPRLHIISVQLDILRAERLVFDKGVEFLFDCGIATDYNATLCSLPDKQRLPLLMDESFFFSSAVSNTSFTQPSIQSRRILFDGVFLNYVFNGTTNTMYAERRESPNNLLVERYTVTIDLDDFNIGYSRPDRRALLLEGGVNINHIPVVHAMKASNLLPIAAEIPRFASQEYDTAISKPGDVVRVSFCVGSQKPENTDANSSGNTVFHIALSDCVAYKRSHIFYSGCQALMNLKFNAVVNKRCELRERPSGKGQLENSERTPCVFSLLMRHEERGPNEAAARLNPGGRLHRIHFPNNSSNEEFEISRHEGSASIAPCYHGFTNLMNPKLIESTTARQNFEMKNSRSDLSALLKDIVLQRNNCVILSASARNDHWNREMEKQASSTIVSHDCQRICNTSTFVIPSESESSSFLQNREKLIKNPADFHKFCEKSIAILGKRNFKGKRADNNRSLRRKVIKYSASNSAVKRRDANVARKNYEARSSKADEATAIRNNARKTAGTEILTPGVHEASIHHTEEDINIPYNGENNKSGRSQFAVHQMGWVIEINNSFSRDADARSVSKRRAFNLFNHIPQENAFASWGVIKSVLLSDDTSRSIKKPFIRGDFLGESSRGSIVNASELTRADQQIRSYGRYASNLCIILRNNEKNILLEIFVKSHGCPTVGSEMSTRYKKPSPERSMLPIYLGSSFLKPIPKEIFEGSRGTSQHFLIENIRDIDVFLLCFGYDPGCKTSGEDIPVILSFSTAAREMERNSVEPSVLTGISDKSKLERRGEKRGLKNVMLSEHSHHPELEIVTSLMTRITADSQMRMALQCGKRDFLPDGVIEMFGSDADCKPMNINSLVLLRNSPRERYEPLGSCRSFGPLNLRRFSSAIKRCTMFTAGVINISKDLWKSQHPFPTNSLRAQLKDTRLNWMKSPAESVVKYILTSSAEKHTEETRHVLRNELVFGDVSKRTQRGLDREPVMSSEEGEEEKVSDCTSCQNVPDVSLREESAEGKDQTLPSENANEANEQEKTDFFGNDSDIDIRQAIVSEILDRILVDVMFLDNQRHTEAPDDCDKENARSNASATSSCSELACWRNEDTMLSAVGDNVRIVANTECKSKHEEDTDAEELINGSNSLVNEEKHPTTQNCDDGVYTMNGDFEKSSTNIEIIVESVGNANDEAASKTSVNDLSSSNWCDDKSNQVPVSSTPSSVPESRSDRDCESRADEISEFTDTQTERKDLGCVSNHDVETTSGIELEKGTNVAGFCYGGVDQLRVDCKENLCLGTSRNDTPDSSADHSRFGKVVTSSETVDNVITAPTTGTLSVNSLRDMRNDDAVVATQEINVVSNPEALMEDLSEKTGCCGCTREECTLPRGSVLSGVSTVGALPQGEGAPAVPSLQCGVSSAMAKVNGEESLIKEEVEPTTDTRLRYSDKRRSFSRKLRRDYYRSTLLFRKSTELALLVEEYLKDVFVPFESVKTQLVRQSRDILLCRYHGDFQQFRERFLIPVANLLRSLKSKYLNPVCVCGRLTHSHHPHDIPYCTACIGWPLCYNRRLVVHLGDLDEALVKPGDFYFCVRETTGSETGSCGSSVYLSFKYRSKSHQDVGEAVRERRVDEKGFGSLFAAMDWMESTESEVMISDDQLTSVLQHLLLSVERGIERLEWDGVSKYWSTLGGQTGNAGRCCHVFTANTKDSSVQTSPEHEVTPSSNTTTTLCVSEDHPSVPSTKQDVAVGKDVCSDSLCFGVSSDCLKEQKPRGDETILMLSDVGAGDEESDDGYYEHTISHPTTISQVDPDLLHSEIALLPGCRDSSGRSVVVLYSAALKENRPVSACHLAQLLLYFRTIPKKEVVCRGFMFLIDATDPCDDLYSVLDETFCLLEANVSNAIGQVVLYAESETLDVSSLFPTSRIRCEIVTLKEKLQAFIRRDQLLSVHGGTYGYDHQEWISFRKFLEPFINGCRLSGRHLVELLEELRGSRLPSSSALTHQMIEQQKNSVRVTFNDEQLRHLEEEGDTILKELESYRTRSPHNADYSENLERTTVLYDELRKAMSKLSRLADKRLRRLEECLQMRTFQEESSQVLSWLCRKGTDSLEKHQAISDSLGGIKEQEEEFEKFYFLAMRQIERGNDLLEEVSTLAHESSLPKIREESQSSEDEGGVQELATSLRQHLGSFSEKLEGTRERIEDTAKCYQLMDKSYEWALEAMQFVSRMGLSNTGNAEGIVHQIRCLQEYLDDNLPVSDDTFQEIMDLATRLNSDKLSEQCKVAKLRCQETVDLIQARLTTLMKVKQQMEVDSFRGPLWDSDESAPTPRSSRSHSQPSNIWTPLANSTPYPACLGHFRRCSDSTAIHTVPQSYGYQTGSYTSFPSSYYPTAKDAYHLDSYIQEKEEQLLQRGLITEDLTCQGPVTSISRGFLDSRIGHRDGPSSTSSSSSSSSSSKGVTSVLRSSGRGSYTVNSSGGVSLRWSKKHSRRCQSWQLRDEALEKIKSEVREQNALLRVEKLSSHESSSDSICSNSETDLSPSSENCCKLPLSHTQSDPVRGPVPVNTHLLTQTSSSDTTDAGSSDTTVTDAEAKAKKTLMLIMKEMIQTERDYVKSLEYIIENYIPELLREDIPQALRGQRNVVFGNIEKICEFHSQFFLSELEQCQNTPFVVGQCFLKYEPQFYLYALYNKNKPKSDALMIEYGNSFFRKKQLELEDKMDLASYLLKPVQRMGKYALLLKQLLKECPEREMEHQDLKAAEEMVRFQLRHGNDLLAMDALRDCDVNVKEQGRLLRQDEFLVWQGRSRKSLRHVFLFEDLILFSKARRDPQRKGYEMYQYKHSIKTTDMGLTEQIGDSPTKFEIWFRKRKLNDTYLLQALSPDIKAAWVHELSKLLWKQALRNREMRLAEMSSMGIGNKPCLDIKPSEDQISDRSISVHQLARAPRFRNSIGMSPYDAKSNKRPHSIISVSSSSSSGSSQSSFTFYGTLNLGFEPGDSPRPLHRSLTQQSQCSTESGFCTDTSTAGDSPTDIEQPRHKKAERSDSLLSSDSMSTNASPSDLNCSPCEEQAVEESITTSM